MSTQKPLPPPIPYDDDEEPEVRHSADEIRDEGALKSIGEAMSEVILGSEDEPSTASGGKPDPAKSTGPKSTPS